MIDFERILAEKGVKKQDFAEMLGEKPQNVNRTVARLNKNLSEIENILERLGTSLKNELGNSGTQDLTDRLLSIIESQQRTMENTSKKVDVDTGERSAAAI